MFFVLEFFFQASYHDLATVLLVLIVFFGTNVLLILLCFWPICCVLVCCIFSPNCLIVFWILLWFFVPLCFCFYYDFSLESPFGFFFFGPQAVFLVFWYFFSIFGFASTVFLLVLLCFQSRDCFWFACVFIPGSIFSLSWLWFWSSCF